MKNASKRGKWRLAHAQLIFVESIHRIKKRRPIEFVTQYFSLIRFQNMSALHTRTGAKQKIFITKLESQNLIWWIQKILRRKKWKPDINVLYIFRDTFYRKFNLRFKQPPQDTCDFCDKIKFKIESAPLKTIERMKLIESKENHLERVELVNREYKKCVSDSKFSADEKVFLVFDLEKVLPTP